MNIQNNDLGLTFPNSLYYQPTATLGFPSATEAYDLYSNSGSGIGRGSIVIKKSIGEYFERRHFYIEIAPDVKDRLSKSLTTQEAKSFTEAFTQTSHKNLKTEKITDHKYQLTKVYRLHNLTPCHIPTACISLDSSYLFEDNDIYPHRDTCGCCFHWNPELSMFGAIKELLERQFLLKFWLTKTCTKKIPDKDILKKIKTHEVDILGKALSEAGELLAFDISDPDFPGKCILTIYGQQNKNNNVKYCAGLSYASTEEEAISISIGELWQTFRFINLFLSINGDIETLHDPYLRYFLSCNDYNIFRNISDCTAQKNTRNTSDHDFNFSGLRNTLIKRKISGYFYIKFREINEQSCIFSKFISPDLFMHMNNSQNFNLKNKYSSKFMERIIDSQTSIMVPFP